ncbi:hypothetical protein [Paenibacillus sp. LHD-38]|uniref:hypothetical protein n=1 Tax=Paenibacillus sp. LHD-38 TaxID=3072143 RepID=UPI00280CD360|nr:hypothetical protein [Paenibacillus sp. LHD-38]MDQ8733962.1 hypothetical protein [Paenibacillus sp. LHD-38]
MEGAPLEYSKKACQFATDQLDRNDQLSIVVFDDQVQTMFAHQNAMQGVDEAKKMIAAGHSACKAWSRAGKRESGIRWSCKRRDYGQIEAAFYRFGQMPEGSILLLPSEVNERVCTVRSLLRIIGTNCWGKFVSFFSCYSYDIMLTRL